MTVARIVSLCLRSRWWLVAGGLTAIVCLELLALYGPQLIKQAVDMVAAGRADARSLLRLGGAIGGLALGVAALRVFGRPLLMTFGRTVERELRNGCFRQVIELPRTELDRYAAGDIMARATYDVDNIQTAAGYGFQAAFHSLLTLVLAMAYMLAMSPMLTLVAAVPMAFIPWFTRRQSRRLHGCHRAIQNTFAALTEESRDSFNAIRVIKTYDLVELKSGQFRKSVQAHIDNNMRLARINALYSPAMTTITHASQATVWGFGGVMAVQGTLTPGDVVAFSTYLAMLRTPLTYSGYLVNLYQRARSSRRRVEEILRPPVEMTAAGPPRASIPKASAALRDITIRDLTFAYPGERDPVLRNVSLHLPAGTANALVGAVGCGKSTLLKLLARIYDPPEGTIFLGDEDIVLMPLDKLRGIMETVAQDPFVFSDSVRENLSMACPEASERALWQALEDVGLAREIKALPGGLDAMLGEKGCTLSGGQQARLALARSLLSNRQVFLLDDPLSSVDTEGEAFVLRNLARIRKGCTNLIVSHRPLSLAFSESIVVLEKGRVVAHGAHRELVGQCAQYRRLVRAQQLTAKVKGV